MFFHGSPHKIGKFTDEFVGGKEANDQEGPGIYFTSSWKNARSYGGYVYTVKLNPRKVVSIQDGKKAPVKELTWLAKKAPNWEMYAQDWDENPEIGVKKEVAAALDYNDNPHQQFQQIWIDFYRNNPVDYIKNMVKLGYDLVYVPNRNSIISSEENITHAVVFNPAIIEFVEMEDDRTEEEKKISEIRNLVRKTLQENVSNNLNDNFWKWFSGSKVVDGSGNPLPVHHGTSKKFSKFNFKNSAQQIIWFASNKGAVEAGEVGAQGKGHIMDLYVSMKNPAGWDEYQKYGLGQLESMGYDGAILPDPDGTFTGFVFEPTQIKAVTNKGDWNPENKNIFKEEEASQHPFDLMPKVDLEFEKEKEELDNRHDLEMLNVVKKYGGVEPEMSFEEFYKLLPGLWKTLEDKLGKDIYEKMRQEIPSTESWRKERDVLSKKYFAKKREIEKGHKDPYALKGDINSPVLYHYTTTDSMSDILYDNTIYDYGGEGTGISTTTNPNLHQRGFMFWWPNEYSKGKHHENVPIIFVLDFNKIKADKFKFRVGSEEVGTHAGEEEIQLKAGELPNLNKYLVKFIFHTKAFENEEEKNKAIALANQYNIPYELR